MVECSSSNPKVVKATSKGKITALKKGESVLKLTLEDGTHCNKHFKVFSNPWFSKDDTIVTSVSVKSGKTVKVKINGKANAIKNSYKNTRYAKVISKKSAKTIKIKGLAKGKSTLKITVNGKKLKLKVNVV